MDALALLVSQPLYLALVMLLAGGAALIWPALASSGRGNLKRRMRVEEDQSQPTAVTNKPTSNALRKRAEKSAHEFYAKTDPENVARLRLIGELQRVLPGCRSPVLCVPRWSQPGHPVPGQTIADHLPLRRPACIRPVRLPGPVLKLLPRGAVRPALWPPACRVSCA
jgi:hypothetical protein